MNKSHFSLLIPHFLLKDMKKFILLLNHDDISLSAYLQHCMKKGKRFVKASGNIFTFKKSEPSEDRIAAVTYANDDPDLKMKFQIEDYVLLMKKRGWTHLCTGAPEDIFDSKRHVFLQTDRQDIPFPNTSPDLAKKAKDHELRSCIRCFAMLLLLLGFAIFFISHDLDVFLSSVHILIPCVIAFILWTVSLVWNIRGALTLKRKAQCADGFKNYLAVDKAVLFCLFSVVCLFVSLLMDLCLYPDHGRTLVFGDQRITVYQDQLPLSLEDLSIPAEGLFRSSRLTVRSGPLMNSMYGSDQSFSDSRTVEDLSLISYSVFQSRWQKGVEWIQDRKGGNRYPLNDEFAEIWHADEVHSDGHHRLYASYSGKVLIFYTSADLMEIDPEIVMGKLFP